jgi:hypothetical protein
VALDGSHAGPAFELRTTSCERLELSSVSSGARDAKVVLAGLGRASEDTYGGFLIFALSQRPPIIPNPHIPAPQCHDANEETSATIGSEYPPANPSAVTVVFRRAWTLGCIAIKHGSPAALSDPLRGLKRRDSFLLLLTSLAVTQSSAKS